MTRKPSWRDVAVGVLFHAEVAVVVTAVGAARVAVWAARRPAVLARRTLPCRDLMRMRMDLDLAALDAELESMRRFYI